MVRQDNRFKILKNYNPFTSSSVGDPWISKYPDVPSINKHAFKGTYQLMNQKAKNSALNCACLILGEVGSGKTHLIGRMLEHSRTSNFPFSFAYIQPIEDSHKTFTYLLREVIINLCHPLKKITGDASYDTQLYRLVNNILQEACPEYKPVAFGSKRGQIIEIKEASVFQRLHHKFIGSVFGEPKNKISGALQKFHKKAILLLRRTYPEIYKGFLDVLFQYTLPEKQAAAIEWLKGNILDKDDANLLQVSDRSQLSSIALELEARDILNSLGILLGRYSMPMLVCFDRLENLETNEQIHALGKMIEFMVDKVQAMLPVACFRGQQWEEKFRHKLNQHVVSRLENNSFELEACTFDMAVEIIETRLASVLGEHKAYDLFPFNRKDLEEIFRRRLYSPRSIINIANEKLCRILRQEPARPASSMEKLKEFYENQKQIILKDWNRYPPDRGRLRRALELYMNYRPEQSSFEPVESSKRQKDDSIDLIVKMQYYNFISSPAIFIIDLAQHHLTVKNRIQKGITCLIEHSPVKVFYIRDERCIFPGPQRWKETNQKLQRFTRLGGNVIFLDHENAASWYALALLSYAVKEGDITISHTNERMRAVSWIEFEDFVRKEINEKNAPAFQGLEDALKTPPEEKLTLIKAVNF
ncbi:ATP-binding protein [Candidatus Magnetomoraceae bacterium gMMP-15]